MNSTYSQVMDTIKTFLEWFIRLFSINIVWFIMNIPFFIVLVNFIMDDLDRFIYLPTLFVLFPLLFFPSLMSLYATVRSIVRSKLRKKLIRHYFCQFKKEYVRSLLAGLIWTLIWAIWLVDVYYFNMGDSWLGFIFILIGFILFVYMIQFMSTFVHFDLKIRDAMKNALMITIGHPLLFIIILVTHAVLFYITISKFWIIFPIIVGSLTAYISFLAYYYFVIQKQAEAS